MHVKTHGSQRGFSLVEVFVALLVMSVGLIALAKLQVDLVRGSSDARARTIALNLAEEKIEDLRTFAVADSASAWSVTANPMAWSHINGPDIDSADTVTPSTGGRIGPQTSYSSALEVAGIRFLRTWEETARNFTGTGPITARTKDVRVTVSWQNEAGTTQSVNLVANLVDIPPGNVALASQPVSDRPDGPQIGYTPGEAPEVIGIPIDTGTGKRETTKPLPVIKKTADSTTVTFDVVNYSTDTNTVSRREEFVTITCKCTFNGTGKGRTPAKVAFVAGALRDEPGKIFPDKKIGVPADSLQPVLCKTCCRDHHDYSSAGVNYFYKPKDTTAHSHYLKTSLSTAVTTGNYDEACRLKRINGVFQVFEDWQLRTLTVLPKTDLLAAAPKQAEYINAVQSFVQSYGAAVADGAAPPSALSFTPSPVTVSSTSQLLSRAIYIDDMPPALATRIGDLLSDGDTTNDLLALSLTPFYELHLTKLANWISRDTALTKARVTSHNIPDGPGVDDGTVSGGLYSRGFVQAQPGATPGTTRIISTAKNYNTGITGTLPINQKEDDIHPITFTQVIGAGPSAIPYYYSDTDPEATPLEHKDGSMVVTIDAAITIAGGFVKAAVGSSIASSKINTPTATGGAVCVTTAAVSPAVEGYSCTIPSSGWTGTITFSSSTPKNYSFCLSDSPIPCSTTTKLSGSSSVGNWVITTPVTTNITQPIYVYEP